MKKFLLVSIFIICCFIDYGFVNAQRGCCSHHGGVSSKCTSYGSIVCNDGTVSPSCTCTPSTNTENTYKNISTIINGCTDANAINYNSQANNNDGSCKYQREQKENVDIEYETKYEDNDELEKGKENIVQEGKNGLKEIIYKITYDENNKELSKEVTSEKIIYDKTDKIVEVGAKEEDDTLNLLVGTGVIGAGAATIYAIKKKEKVIIK